MNVEIIDYAKYYEAFGKWDIHEFIENWNNLMEEESRIYVMDDFDRKYDNYTPSQIAYLLHECREFDINDEYFAYDQNNDTLVSFNGYEILDYIDLDAMIERMIDEGIEIVRT